MILPGSVARQLFFTGKGGVGKTSVACASAIALADGGGRVLLVSTDPASNLDEVLGVSLAPTATAIPSVPRLFALNLDPEAAARAYREKIVGPYRGLLPAASIASMEEQLSGACTVEIAAFDEFARLLGEPAFTDGIDHVLFDTAPTGHTLRLLALPGAWSEFVRESSGGASCLGPLAGLTAQRSLYEATLAALSDGARTRFVIVARPEISALVEAERTRSELSALGITAMSLVVNAIFRAPDTDDPLAFALDRRTRAALAAAPPQLLALPRREIALHPRALLGVAALRAFADDTSPSAPRDETPATPATVDSPAELLSLATLVDAIERGGDGVVLAMGKGGVGKTTIAASVAVELARRGHRVRLTTTDPAAHLTATVGAAPIHLAIDRIDPALETRRYVEEVLANAGAGLDDAGRALLEEDLRSPCTEEVAVFRAFARTVDEGARGFVILDTAPTGHTLLLLDATAAYHREVLRQKQPSPDQVTRLLPRLRDPKFTRVLLVTLPEPTPIHEAGRLQDELRRAGIEPFAWVVNQSLAPCRVSHPLLVARKLAEAPLLEEVITKHAPRVALVPWQPEPPVGVALLLALARAEREISESKLSL